LVSPEYTCHLNGFLRVWFHAGELLGVGRVPTAKAVGERFNEQLKAPSGLLRRGSMWVWGKGESHTHGLFVINGPTEG
jgi:hypothetical protein